jgi:putative tryptophan/tyrosine transport system substrate-binding protein
MKIAKEWRSVSTFLILGAIGASVLCSAREGASRPAAVRIGIIQTLSSPDYDAATRGFVNALAEAGFVEGKHVAYDRQNAEGDKEKAGRIVQKFLDQKVALVYSVATPASQAAVRRIRTIPIVFSSVTDPRDARLVPQKSSPGSKTGTNVTGVSDHWPVFSQLQMYSSFFPKAKKWGTIYAEQDPRVLHHIKEMRASAKRLGLELIESRISAATEAGSAAEALSGRIQVLNLPFDPVVLSSLGVIVKVCNEKKIPLFSGDVRSVSRGALAAYGVDYFHLGYRAGKKAVRILKGESAGEIPWEPAEKLLLVINESAARAQGAIISSDLLKRADKLIQ